ncbi:MAG TPA: FadR/GntR family transcriptional regulator [Terracidiphilus sp.]|jgi:GntR family transcriptional repressor for pyruvate dehydrogenase complex|nr:FadR/GntR family transcriptional regulator [Terracidiphilus sp.]
MKKPLETSTRMVGSKIRPITKISISEEIAKQIIDLISTGDLKAGQRLPSERELCAHFGASRSSLREALRCLSIVGVLNARVGDGTSVAADGGKFLRKIVEWRLITERHDIENLMEVRIALEGVSAANAALRATDDDIEKFQALLVKMKAAAKDAKKFAVLDVEFHVALANASGNALVFDLVSMIRGHLVRVLPKVLLLPNAMPLSTQEHVAIVEAIERRNAEDARAAMHAHLEAVLQRYVRAEGGAENRRAKQSVKPAGEGKQARRAAR